MVAKLICHAETRAEAIEGLSKMAWDTQVWPVKTNASFVGTLVVMPDFVRGEIDTGFIARHLEDIADDVNPPQWLQDLVAQRLAAKASASGVGPEGFRLNAGIASTVRMSDRGRGYVGAKDRAVPHDQRHIPLLRDDGDCVLATLQGATWRFGPARIDGGPGGSTSDGAIVAPMPGKVIAVDVAAGDVVTKGQKLLVLEAMKMEHALTAPFDGTVAELTVSVGSQVQVEALLARVEAG
jgi:3-methylcrotonyl-CoA carboxylase alpha subunit